VTADDQTKNYGDDNPSLTFTYDGFRGTDGPSDLTTEPTCSTTAGKFSDASTGGGHDAFGNLMPLHTDWTAPAADKLDGPTPVSFWIIQRDERLGLTWYQACFLVTP